ncbi:NUDIX domain-containing protein [Altererythrobacter aestiaquae]|uniref:8-oxo-dGTP diphosphatase n=2 Tax=Pontixanthobacter aestiaquae TaxID=1509367 RepID=A0A844Z8I8_9SPHN|nr:NUDIX domain-containing protein [Pontixanthobacter aestiaquae]
MPVVAAAIGPKNGRWLMHRRPVEKQHGGLWEFPGGKVESDEAPEIAVIREIKEELNLRLEAVALTPAGFAQADRDNGQKQIVILLYKTDQWEGVPQALEGGEIAWFAPEEIAKLDKPPLDIALAKQLFAKSASETGR